MYTQSAGPCRTCKGQGRVVEAKNMCKSCKGNRVLKERKVIEV